MEMEVCGNPTVRSKARSSSIVMGFFADPKRIELCSSAVSAVLGIFFYAILIFFFGVVGTTLGATTGALSGLNRKRGFMLHGAVVGAIAGAYFSIDAVKASVGFWKSFDNGPVSFLHLIEVITTLLNPTLQYLGEQFGRVDVVETTNEIPRFIDDGGVNITVYTRGSVDHRLSKVRITDRNIYDTSRNRICCSVCLEDFKVGEVAGRLPLCQHMFHRPCIAKWRTRHTSCPLCRRHQ